MNDQLRKWIRRSAVLFASFLILIIVITNFKDSLYERALIWSAEYFFDCQFTIEGSIDVDITRNLLVSAERIQISANDDSYRVSIGRMDIEFRLGSYLQTGAFWFNNLRLEHVKIDIIETPNEQIFDIEDLEIPPLIISQAKIYNLALTYQELAPGTAHTFLLDEFFIESEGAQQPLSLYATGLLKNRRLQVQGTVDSIDKLVESHQPIAIDVQIDSSLFNARVEGAIAEPLTGKGLDLLVEMDIPQARDIFEILWDEIPNLGGLEGRARVLGDYNMPRLEAINLHLYRDEDVNLNISGSVSNVVKGSGINIHLDGKSNDPSINAWLLFKKFHQLKSIQAKLILQGNLLQLSLQGVDAFATTDDDLNVYVSGNASILQSDYQLSRKDADLKLQFSAPSITAINLPEIKKINLSGPISGSAHVALAVDMIGIFDTTFKFDDSRGSWLLASGDIGRLPLTGELQLSGLHLQIDLQVVNSSALAAQFGYEIPSIGPARLRGTLLSRGSDLVLQPALLDLGTKRKVTLTAKGLLLTSQRDLSELKLAMDFEVQTAEFSQLAELFGYSLPNIGHTKITGWLEATKFDLQFIDTRMVLGGVGKPTARVTSKIIKISPEGSELKVSFDASASDLIAKLSDLSPEHLGRLTGNALISEMDGNWALEYFHLASANTKLYELRMEGEYKESKTFDEANIKFVFEIEQPQALGKKLGMNWNSVRAFRQQGLLKLGEGRIAYLGESQIGSTTSQTDINGYFEDDKPVLSGSFKIPVLNIEDFGIGAVNEKITETTSPDNSDRSYIFSKEKFSIDFLHKADLNIGLSIGKIVNVGTTFYNIEAMLNVKNGQLNFQSTRLSFEGGHAEMSLSVDTTQLPHYKLYFSVNDAILGALIAKLQDWVPIRGYSNIVLDLHASGYSPHELASSLSGNVSLGIENAQVPTHYIDFLSSDVFGWVLSQSVRKQDFTNLNCVMLAFDIKQGEVESRVIVADGPRLNISGDIKMDLAHETLDILLIPKQKQRVFSSISPIKVTGSIADPQVSAMPVNVAMKEIGTKTLLAGIYIPLRAVEKLFSLMNDNDKYGGGCENIIDVSENSNENSAVPRTH